MGEVKLFEDLDCYRLDKRKVFKFGVIMDKMMGFVCKIDFVLELGEILINVFLIELYEKSNEELIFFKFGDSGVVVLIKFGKYVEVFFMIFVGDVNILEVVKNNIIVVELKYVVDKFEYFYGIIFELNIL